jgi:putative CocE/NonD family hydrolase
LEPAADSGVTIEMVRRTLVAWLPLVVLVSVFPSCRRAARPTGYYSYHKVMVPMRDGVQLETVLLTPNDSHGARPILLTRTPYGVPNEKEYEGFRPDPDSLDAGGYIRVLQSVRGRFGSGGQFEMIRPPRSLGDPKAVDEVTDAWDTVEWLVKNVPGNTGRVGMIGTSYAGWLVAQASLAPHPALKVAIEEASPQDLFLNDDFHHNGAFRLSYGFEYSAMLETSKTENVHFEFDRGDTYDWYLGLGALSNADTRHFHAKIPTWINFVAHPNRDGYWEERALTTYLSEPKVPILHVGGWWDEEDMVGPQTIYAALDRKDTRHLNHLVVGPWSHGQWGDDGSSLGPIQFGSDTSLYYRKEIRNKWLADWLYGEGPAAFPKAQTFQTGANRWQSYDTWPPEAGISRKRIYLHPGGRLSFAPPDAAAKPFDEYVSDPAHPVPYRPRPVTPTYPGTEWPVWMVQDQRFVDRRGDVLTFATDPLPDDLTITGDVVAELFASTTGTDADWIVKLIDVCPSDGTYNPTTRQSMAEFQWMLNAEIVRARFRDSLTTAKPVPPNEVLRYAIDLHGNDHVFRKKHRIMVQVQSSWFPVYDRNPQKFVPNIFAAVDADFQAATHRVFHASAMPSAILLPVNTRSSTPPEAPDNCYPPLTQLSKIDPATLDRYAGRYRAAQFPIAVRREGGQLTLEQGGDKVALQAVSETTFYSGKLNLELTFAPDSSGTVRAVAVRSGPGKVEIAYREER